MKLLRSVSFLALGALATIFLSGCSTALNVHKAVSLAPYKRIYVESRLSDNHRLDEQIANELKSYGVDATFGVSTMRPDKVDAIVTYEDRWQWDFKDYLIDMQIDLRETRGNKPIATGHYHQAGITTKTSAEVIHLILSPLFKK
jgi:coenzyme F420-reducing hydrogenase beta subunit